MNLKFKIKNLFSRYSVEHRSEGNRLMLSLLALLDSKHLTGRGAKRLWQSVKVLCIGFVGRVNVEVCVNSE
jgi:hypothetical protein